MLAVVGMTLWGLAGAALGRGATARIGAATVDRAGAAVLAAFSVVVARDGLRRLSGGSVEQPPREADGAAQARAARLISPTP